MVKRAKILSVILSAIMVCNFATGCGSVDNTGTGGNTQSDASVGTEVSQSSQESADASGKEASEEEILNVEIWSGDASKEAIYLELIEQYNKTIGKEAGISLNLTISSEVNTLLSLAQENGELPLLTDGTGSLPQEEGGWVMPISKLPGGQDFVDGYGKKVGGYAYINRLTGSNDVYKFPVSVTGAGVYYNKDMFKDAGIVDENGEAKAPATWSEVLEYSEILTDNTHYGLAFQGGWGNSLAMYTAVFESYGSQGTCWTVDWDTLEYTFDIDEPFGTLAEIYQKGYCVPGAEEIDNDTARSYFSEGIAGMFLGYSWDIGVFTTQYVADFDWGVCGLVDENGVSHGGATSYTWGFLPTIAVADLSETDQEKIMNVIEWLYGEDVQVALTEAGLIYPANREIMDKIDTGKLIPQSLYFVEIAQNGTVPSPTGTEGVLGIAAHLDYEPQNVNALLTDTLWKVVHGEMTTQQADEFLNEKLTASLKASVEEGYFDLEDFFEGLKGF